MRIRPYFSGAFGACFVELQREGAAQCQIADVVDVDASFGRQRRQRRRRRARKDAHDSAMLRTTSAKKFK